MRALEFVRWPRLLLVAGCLATMLMTSPLVIAQDAAEAATQEAPKAEATEAAPAETTPAAGEAPAETAAPAAAPAYTVDDVGYTLNNMMLMICAVLVLFMQAGFALVEVGFNASKNAVNILFKNVMDLLIGVLLYYVIGYGMMYPGPDFAGKWYGFAGVGIPEMTDSPVPGVLHKQVDFLFQVAFAATAATIVSGAVAGRMKFVSYLIYSAVITGLIYPVSGMWKWGGGYLATAGFHDFAGSILVHSVGGFAGLAGAIVLGARRGRFGPDGKSHAMPGHNLTFAALGVFILLVGWYGFNPGSQLAFVGASNTATTLLIATNTTLAAAAGGTVSMILSWVAFGKPDLSMALNGILAGLVGITANCDCVTNNQSLIIGAIAGVIVIASIMALDKLRIDDPVGAFPVHGACGVWGGIATGIFGANKDLITQLMGTGLIVAWSFITMFILFAILNAIGILRVDPEEEEKGLDLSEHGMEAYYHG